jgi:hypothetical protein
LFSTSTKPSNEKQEHVYYKHRKKKPLLLTLPLLQQNLVHKAKKEDKNHTNKNTHNAPCQKI